MGNDEPSLVGRTLGEFTIREHLSSGGFGMVFRAEQPALRREAVIKVLHTQLRSSETGVQRFLREAQLASALDHPYAAHTYAFGAEPDGLVWIAMELVRGTPLDKMLAAQGPIPLERFVPLLDALCEVIHTAHEQGIVHRDLKPGNVMVLARAGRLLPKLLDLGIARLVGAPPEPPGDVDPSLAITAEGELTDTRLTQRGSVMGSPMYMAPEQWIDAGEADARTDQYSLGVMCYEALTGRCPFTGSHVQVALAHARKPPPPLGPGFPPALDAVLARAMAKSPKDRYPDVLQLAAAFRVASGVAVETPPLPRLPEELRLAVLAKAPQPIAQAVAALDAARNAHQARDALWQLVRVAVRLVGVTALAAHGHVGAGTTTHSEIGEVLRRLRRRALADAEWLELARRLCRPFAAMRDAHPIPELIGLLAGDPALAALVDLHASADESGGGSDEQVRDLLARALPLAAAALGELAFFSDYRLIVPGEQGAEVWMGERRADRARLPLHGRALATGQPALADAGGVPILSLWPFVQLHAPSAGAADALFFFEGKGRRGARLIALPDAFEHDDDELWQALGAIVDDAPDAAQTASSEERCPFPGLAAFTRADAASFLGRERETESAINHLRSRPLLAVVGPSGSGKSSFVQAGVIPAMPDGWDVIAVRPGPAPLVTLTARLVAAGLDVGDLRAELQEHPGALGSLLRTRRRTTVLFVDQLEELFTLCDDPQERALYAEALMRAARSADDPVRVVVTLRDDFLIRADALPAFRTRLGQNLQLLSTPADADLRRILTESVARAGYELDDPTLPDEIVASLAGTPGALALLSFTASKLWEVRDRRFRQLGRKAYASLGGVGGALAHHAEATLEAMPHEEQRLVREVFRHLVTAEGTRAVLSHQEIGQVLGGGPHASAVIEKLVAARLLVVSESEGGTERVEVAHEALLDAWPRLVAWRREDAEGARLRDQLRAAARQWEERRRPGGLLWRGDALAEYRLWRARYPGTLTHSEEAFAAASLADAARARNRRRLLLAAAFLVLGAGIVGLLVLNSRAEQQRVHAEEAATALQRNLQRQYENQGRRLLLDGDPLQALAYLDHAHTLGAAGPAHDFLVASAVRETDGELLEVSRNSAAGIIRFSPGGDWFLTAGWNGSIERWDARTGRPLGTLEHDAGVRGVEISPDGATLMARLDDGSVAIWDLATASRARSLRAAEALRFAQWTTDARRVVGAGEHGRIVVWDVASGAELGSTASGLVPADFALSADGSWLAIADAAGAIGVWSVDRLERVATLSSSMHDSLVFSPDSQLLVTSGDERAAVWRWRDARVAFELHHTNTIMSVVFSDDGTRIATASNDHTAALWDARTGERLQVLTGHQAGVNGAVFSGDGARLFTISDDGTVRAWDLSTGKVEHVWFGHGSAVIAIRYDVARGLLGTGSDDGVAILWDAGSGSSAVRLRGHTGAVRDVAFSPTGGRVVTGGNDGTVRLWDPTTGQERTTLWRAGGAVVRARFSPDGERIAVAERNGRVAVLDAHDGSEKTSFQAGESSLRDLSWAPAGDRLVTADAEGTVRVWSWRDGSARADVTVAGYPGQISAQFTGDGTQIVTASNGIVRFLDARTGEEARKDTRFANAIGLRFDPAGTRAAILRLDAISIWDLSRDVTVSELLGHAAYPTAAAWTPGGEIVVTAATDGTVRAWDPGTGVELARYEQGTQVFAVDVSSDGSHIASSADDGSVIVRAVPRYEASEAEMTALLRCRVPYFFVGDRLRPRPRDPTACHFTTRAM